jgi:hypothetical protein
LLEVFGDDDDPEDLGMDVDHLLDRVSARLIYAPAYACTSFVVRCIKLLCASPYSIIPLYCLSIRWAK